MLCVLYSVYALEPLTLRFSVKRVQQSWSLSCWNVDFSACPASIVVISRDGQRKNASVVVAYIGQCPKHQKGRCYRPPSSSRKYVACTSMVTEHLQWTAPCWFLRNTKLQHKPYSEVTLHTHAICVFFCMLCVCFTHIDWMAPCLKCGSKSGAVTMGKDHCHSCMRPDLCA